MAGILGVKTHRLKRAIDRLIERQMLTKTERRGYPSVFQITTMRIKGWGQTALGVAPNGPTPPVPNGPTPQCQTALLTTSLDDTLLSIFHVHFAKWTFNRKPIGKHFVFTRPMQSNALECMRWLHKNAGFSTPQLFDQFLSECGEYLSLDRDVLSPHKDQRALSPGKWLSDWPEQIRLAGIYRDEKAQKITRIQGDSMP